MPGKQNERELPVGHDRGLVWRINGYWFFEESDGGVFITCESITLTRDIPFLLSKMLSPILHELPPEALKNSLEADAKSDRESAPSNRAQLARSSRTSAGYASALISVTAGSSMVNCLRE